MCLRPFPDRLVVPAPVLRIEVHERHRSLFYVWLVPDLTKYANIGNAHQLLAQNVQAMGHMIADDVFAVHEGPLFLLFVVIIIPLECLSEKVLSYFSIP